MKKENAKKEKKLKPGKKNRPEPRLEPDISDDELPKGIPDRDFKDFLGCGS